MATDACDLTGTGTSRAVGKKNLNGSVPGSGRLWEEIEKEIISEEVEAKSIQRAADLGDGPPPVWDSKHVDGVVRMFLKHAQDLSVKVQIPVSRNIVEREQNFQGIARVALICLENGMSMEEMSVLVKERQAMGCALIPLILPGYSWEEAATWWHERLPEIDQSIACVDLRTVSDWDLQVDAILLPRLQRALEAWRGNLPNLAEFRAGFPGEVLCPECVKEGLDPHVFTRAALNDAASLWVKAQGVFDASTQEVDCTVVCDSGHTQSATTLLDRCSARQAVPCSRCVERGAMPPHPFASHVLRERLRNRQHTRFCPLCDGEVPAADLIIPEVYVSYRYVFGSSARVQEARCW